MRSRPWRILVSYLLLVVVVGGAAAGFGAWLHSVAQRDPILWRSPWAGALAGAGLLLVWVLFHLRQRRSAALAFSRAGDLGRLRPGWVARLSALPAVLRIAAVVALAAALARPQTYRTESLEIEGIDIMVVLDLSRSMEEVDMQRNRLDAAQRTVRRFVDRRVNDRVGLVVFAREAMLRCPMTLDYRAFDEIVASLRIGDVPEIGTAVGDALGLALASMRRSDADSKVVILVSDGESNIANEMSPGEAKRAAMLMGVRVFTVLMGRGADPDDDTYAVNPELLREIAVDTGGIYFGAADDAALDAAFTQVRSTLDKSRRRIAGRSPDRELFPYFAAFALALLLLELLMAMTRWRRFP